MLVASAVDGPLVEGATPEGVTIAVGEEPAENAAIRFGARRLGAAERLVAPSGEGLWRRAPWPAADELFELGLPAPDAPALVVDVDPFSARRGGAVARGARCGRAPRRPTATRGSRGGGHRRLSGRGRLPGDAAGRCGGGAAGRRPLAEPGVRLAGRHRLSRRAGRQRAGRARAGRGDCARSRSMRCGAWRGSPRGPRGRRTSTPGSRSTRQSVSAADALRPQRVAQATQRRGDTPRDRLLAMTQDLTQLGDLALECLRALGGGPGVVALAEEGGVV